MTRIRALPARSAENSVIRVADRAEYAALRNLELEADRLYETVGIGPFTNSPEEDHLEQAAVVFVSGDPPVGFASVELVDGAAHLWQLSVLPSAGRQGRGTALVQAVCAWAEQQGLDAVTLTTFRDVPWNGPFYSKLGFEELVELTPGLAAIRSHERAIGDDSFGHRIAMTLPLAGERLSPWAPHRSGS